MSVVYIGPIKVRLSHLSRLAIGYPAPLAIVKVDVMNPVWVPEEKAMGRLINEDDFTLHMNQSCMRLIQKGHEDHGPEFIDWLVRVGKMNLDSLF